MGADWAFATGYGDCVELRESLEHTLRAAGRIDDADDYARGWNAGKVTLARVATRGNHESENEIPV